MRSRQHGEILDDSLLLPKVIRVERQFQPRAVEGVHERQGVADAGEKRPFGGTTQVHRLDCQRHRVLGRRRQQFSERLSHQPASMVMRVPARPPL